jgi:hypothetical protein
MVFYHGFVKREKSRNRRSRQFAVTEKKPQDADCALVQLLIWLGAHLLFPNNLFQVPNVIRNSCFHRGRDTQRFGDLGFKRRRNGPEKFIAVEWFVEEGNGSCAAR